MRLSLGKTVVFLSTILSLALLTGCSLGTAEMEKTDIDVLSEKNSKSWEQAENHASGEISGACNLYSGTDERG